MASLLTQCPHCQTSFRVSRPQLVAANGQVRCGACLGVFSATANEIRVKPAPPLTSGSWLDDEPEFEPATTPSDTSWLDEEDTTSTPTQDTGPDPSSSWLDDDEPPTLEHTAQIHAPAAQLEDADDQQDVSHHDAEAGEYTAPWHDHQDPSYQEPVDEEYADEILVHEDSAHELPIDEEYADEEYVDEDSAVQDYARHAHPHEEYIDADEEAGEYEEDEAPVEDAPDGGPFVRTEPFMGAEPELFEDDPQPLFADHRDPSPLFADHDDDSLSNRGDADSYEDDPLQNRDDADDYGDDPLLDHDDADDYEDVRARYAAPDSERGAAKARLRGYLDGLEDDDALEELNPDTLEYVDEEPLTLAAEPPSGRLWRSLAFGLGSVVLLALLGLQYVAGNLEALNGSARFALFRPVLCTLLTCPPPAPLPPQFATQQLLVRAHPGIRNALEVSFIFANESTRPQPFPALALQFHDDQDHLVASRRFSPDEYLPPELNALGTMPPASSVQVQLEIVDPGSDATRYSVSYQP